MNITKQQNNRGDKEYVVPILTKLQQLQGNPETTEYRHFTKKFAWFLNLLGMSSITRMYMPVIATLLSLEKRGNQEEPVTVTESTEKSADHCIGGP